MITFHFFFLFYFYKLVFWLIKEVDFDFEFWVSWHFCLIYFSVNFRILNSLSISLFGFPSYCLLHSSITQTIKFKISPPVIMFVFIHWNNDFSISLCGYLNIFSVYVLHVFRGGRGRNHLTWDMLHQVCPFGHTFSSYNHPRGVLRIPSQSSLSLVLSIWAVSFCNHR